METVNYVLYLLAQHFIQACKWIELQFLKLLKPFIKAELLGHLTKLGIVMHVQENGTDSKLKNSKKGKEIILIQGKHDHPVHVKVKDLDQCFLRLLNRGTLGFGETYMDGLWDPCGDTSELAEIIRRVIEGNILDIYMHKWNCFLEWLEFSAFNLQTRGRAFMVGKFHYDLGNELFQEMLDPWMQYSCGYWAKADNLNEAQEHKLELIARKLDLRPGMRVLDLGCGWGTLCKYLAQNYGVSCVGVTVSEEGVAYGKRVNHGLPVEIRLQDYRELDEKFDRIVSIEMFEHVGHKNHKEFMKVVRRCLVDDGIFLLHIYGRDHANIPRSTPFHHRYIFPNACQGPESSKVVALCPTFLYFWNSIVGSFPNPVEVTKALEGLFVIEDWHNFGLDFAKTFQAWRGNFINAWPKLEAKHGKQLEGKFYRMWTFYLCAAEGFFKSRRLQLWQILLSPNGLQKDFRVPR